MENLDEVIANAARRRLAEVKIIWPLTEEGHEITVAATRPLTTKEFTTFLQVVELARPGMVADRSVVGPSPAKAAKPVGNVEMERQCLEAHDHGERTTLREVIDEQRAAEQAGKEERNGHSAT